MKTLDPNQSDSLLAALQKNVATQLREQRELVVRQFSLDEQSTLSRLVKKLTRNQYQQSDKLPAKIDDIVNRAGMLESVETSASTIKKSSEKILKHVHRIRGALAKQVARLRLQMRNVHEWLHER